MNSIKRARKIKGDRKLCLKPIVFAVAYCFALNAAQANPIGAQVVNGTASINQNSNTLTVTNSPNAIINWQGFSINTGETTRFNQQSASSAILNRVVGADPSQLLGTLTSNGKVFLINPAGILVGQGARIDVAGLVASTLNLSNEDFLAGKLNFTSPLTRAGAPKAGNPLGAEAPAELTQGLGERASSVINNGAITTPEGGTVYLVAPKIENQGIITTPKGETILAAGNTVQLVDTGTPGVTVQVTGSDNSATNLGQILADSGRIGMVAATLKNSGTLNASSIVNEGGRIFLRASQDAYVDKDGRIAATGSKGGSIEVLGNRVAVMDNAQLDASGQNGGGSVLVGGDYQGKNPAIQNSQITYFGSNAGIKADAITNGDGGKVIVWADDTTRAYGSISARGGAQGGNGGFVETSGHNYLDFQGRVDTRAPQGSAGTLLLDPADITIDNTVTNQNGGSFGGGVFSGATGPAVLTWATINLQAGSLEIQTSGLGDFISINASGAVTGPTTLTLLARSDITFANAVSVSGGNRDFNLVAGWNGAGWATNSGTGTITFNPNSSLSTTGNLLLSAGNAVTQDPSATITANTLSIIGSQGGTRLPGGASLPGTNMVNTLAVDIAGGGLLTFSNGQALTIGTVGSFSGILAGGNTNPVSITTTAGNLIVSQPIVSDALGGSPINLTAANTLTLNAAVTSTFNATPAGPVVLQAGAGGVTSNASGVIWAGGLKVVSGGGVTLNAANKIDFLAGTSGGSFQFAAPDGFSVNTVQAINGLLAATGDITLKTSAANSWLYINQPVSATTGSVSYIADHMTLAAMTTATTAGKYVEVKPATPATNIDLGGADAAGILGLMAGELGQITTNTLRIGATTAGSINVSAAISPANAGVLSLESGGNITQSGGGTITATNLAIKAVGSVALDSTAHQVANLAALVSGTASYFSFKNTGALNVANSIDGLSGILIPNFTPNNAPITLISGGALTQSAGALLAGSAVYAEGSKVILTNANPTGVIAGKATGNTAGDVFSYTSSNAIQVTTVNGFPGIQNIASPEAISVVLNAGSAGIGQDQPINAGAGTKGLSLTTTGPVNLATWNSVGALTATGVGGLTFQNSGALTVGVAGNGVTTTANQPIAINAAGALTVKGPVNAGTGNLILYGSNIYLGSAAPATVTGGSTQLYATQNNGIVSQFAGGTVSATNGLSINADNISFGGTMLGACQSGGGCVDILPFTAGRPVEIAGAAANPAALSITQTDLAAINPAGSGIVGGVWGTISTSGTTTFKGNFTSPGGMYTSIYGSTISQSAGTTISGGLGVTATGSITLTEPTNQISSLGSQFTSPQSINVVTNVPTLTLLGTVSAGAGGLNITNSGGGITVNDAQVSSTGIVTLVATGGITLNAATADAYISSPDVYLSLGGNLAFTASGAYKAYVSSALLATTHLTFTNATGKVFFNGSQAEATTSGNMGFFYGGALGGGGIPAVVGSSLILVAGDANNFVVVAPPPPPPPTIDQCIADPNISGCSGVLPSLASCTTTPTLAGCSAILPTLASCTTTPTLTGCSAVLPTLASCTTTPTLAGCSAVLPTLASCTTVPTAAGCSAVLPTLSACTTTPTAAGCSAVLPSLASCTTTPMLAGCSAVLPSLASCTTTPTVAGCSAVLPSLASCTTTPTLAGCAVVLPSLAACTVTPTLPGCSVVLPSLASCTATPTLAGCAVVLPSLAACTVTPTLPGCSVVLPSLASCTATPTLPGCTAVLPSLATCTAAPATAGCAAVLPSLAACTVTPTLPGCSVVLPSLASCTATPTLAGCAVVLPSLSACTVTPTLPGCSVVLPSLATCTVTPTLPGCAVVLPSLAICTAVPVTAGCAVVLPAPAAQDTAHVVLQQTTVVPTPTIPEPTITTTATAAPSTAPAAVIANTAASTATAGATGGNAVTTFGPVGGTVGGTAGSFGGADAAESGKGGDKANGSSGSTKKEDTDKKEKDKKDKKDDTDKKDDGNAKDDKNKGKPSEKPEKC